MAVVKTLISSNKAGCSKWPSSKAAGKNEPEPYPRGYVKDSFEPRTKLEAFFNILIER